MKSESKTGMMKEQTTKKLLRIHQSSGMHWVGNGFPVRSVFDYNGLGRELSPFLLLDYAAPYQFPAGHEKRGVGGHPHKGFETVTVAYQGELEHRDSSGGGGKIGAGDVQWMTAGNGIVHEEFHSQDFTRKGGTLQMVQLWVNLRAKDKSAKAGYQTLLKAQIPNVPLLQDAGTVRVIAGEFGGSKGPAKTFTPINLWDVNLAAGKSAQLPLPTGHTSTFLVLSGDVLVNGEREAGEGDLAIFARAGESITVKGNTDAKLLVMDGEPIAEPVVGHGPFVMNSRAEIQQAFEDYQLGKMGELAS
ncbi:MAG TPA: pirin family protein [Verrucomicrobiae bacterium]|nr:pirin family protein [Verrucomicrobiae bacterium]